MLPVYRIYAGKMFVCARKTHEGAELALNDLYHVWGWPDMYIVKEWESPSWFLRNATR